MSDRKVAVVTGASSGIGAASARALAADGWNVVIGARRQEKLEALANEIGATALPLDVTSDESVEKFVGQLDRVDLLVNNAGGAKGMEPLIETAIEDWQWMYETNVLGTVRMIQALLPRLEASEEGLIINMGSVAGWDVYAGGSGYNAAKHGVRVISRALRLENHDVRVTEIDPGRVATEEFSLIRFGGDSERAAAVYDGQVNLVAEDIAEAVRWVASLPGHMNIDTMTIKPRTQS
ncbi:SDR family NAD(P)-dependent oxidoreductase [Corynebacterium camporealensis]|uniref:Short-chain alcohol dehydrogenase n=1 Tax=Corynebacterium camporealensis TaxID=161896 RepID=A0A0F6QWG4_9CORY|nr:SDR family oxidoreductase [Corynebacterium camporealensis]AKE38083.1 short-chain alcohol dehydrogenase [Corynebacterium camporealensis]MDY5840890.1 SDR family oxidoreductase [Corynebacterium camporealensis]